MRRLLLIGVIAAATACSLLVDTSGLSGTTAPADGQPAEGSTPEGSTADGGPSDASSDACADAADPACVTPPLGCDGPCTPILLASENQPRAIVADETGAYWTAAGGGDIRRSSVDGTLVETVYDGNNAPYLLAVDDTNIYWSEPSKGNVRSIAKNATLGILTGEKTGLSGPLPIATAAGMVFWQEQTSGVIRRSTKTLSTIDFVATTTKAIALAADPTYVYVALSNGENHVDRVPHLTAGVAMDVSPKVPDLRSVVLGGGRIFFTSSIPPSVVGSTTIEGQDLRTYGSAEDQPRTVAVDATHVYWGTFGDGLIRRAPIAGGPAQTLAVASQVISIAVNSKAIYWVEEPGAVRMLRKP